MFSTHTHASTLTETLVYLIIIRYFAYDLVISIMTKQMDYY